MLASLAFSLVSIAQQEVTIPAHHFVDDLSWSCSQKNATEQLIQNDPFYKIDLEKGFEQIAKNIAKHPGEKADELFTVPVVFHVLHIGENVGVGSNISDERIQDAVDAMNRDFRRKDDDGGIAQGAGPDMDIEFCLAARDPQGDVHTGINRIDASSITDYSTKGILDAGNQTELKNLSKWPTADYVNIWVVREINDEGDHTEFTGGTLGYAYLPGANPSANANDGIVVAYFSCGNDPTGSDPTLLFDLNRTLTHEMGHHLGLLHPFEGESCTEGDCTTEGDLICDTPPTTLNSNCNSPACGGTQIVENYMDYTGEDCADMFTQGQKDRMRAVLDNGGQRNSLLSSSGCDPNRVEADFSADVTTITIGGTVNFTDESTGAVAPTSWSWSFGDGGTSTTQNPSHVFNSVGYFSIQLAVDNGVNQDTAFKESYIQVVAPVGFCDTLTNANQEDLTFFSITDNWGYFPGHNELMISNYAEEYFVASATNITSLLVPVGQNDVFSNNATTRFIVYADNGGLPGNEITSVTIDSEDLIEQSYNQISFDEPVNINNTFHIGYELTYNSPQDTLLIFLDVKDTENENTLSVNFDGNWMETGDVFSGQVYASSGIMVVTSQGEAVPDIVASATSICPGDTVEFDGTGSSAADSYQWIFNGGNPQTSTQIIEEVEYTTPGTFKAYLAAYRCGSPAIDSVEITVFGSGIAPEFALTSPTTCTSEDGSLEVTNPGSDTYTWLTTPPVVGYTLPNVAAGDYQLEISNGNCADTVVVTLEFEKPTTTFEIVEQDTCQEGTGVIAADVDGTGTYTYEWNAAAAPNQDTLFSAEVGMNYLIITDEDDCEIFNDSLLVESYGQVVDSIHEFLTDVDCNVLGNIDIEIFPGTPTSGEWFAYIDQGTDSILGPPFEDLSNGDYTIDISNGECLSSFGPFTISGGVDEPDYEIEILALDTCATDQGSVAIVIDSTGTFTYEWTGGFTTDTINDVPAESYDILVKDVNGCILISDAIELAAYYGVQPDSTKFVITEDTCGLTSGAIDFTVYPTAEDWDLTLFSTMGNTDTVFEPYSDMEKGTYYYQVGDTLCGVDYNEVIITGSDALGLEIDLVDDTVCWNFGEEAVFSSAISGTGYTINWDFGDGTGTSAQENPSYLYGADGDYTVVATLAYPDGSCEVVADTVVTAETCIGIEELEFTVFTEIYPNPTTGILHISSKAEIATVRLVNALGQKTQLPFTNDQVQLNSMAEGAYIIQIILENGKMEAHKVLIER